MLYLAILKTQIQSNNKFCQKLLLYLKYIIKYSSSEKLYIHTLDQACPNANALMTNP